MSNYLTERYDLASEDLDIPVEDLRKASNEEIKAVTGVSEMTIGADKIAIDGLIEFMTKVVKESVTLTSELNYDILAKAINEYNEQHRKEKEPEQPEMDV